MLVGEEYGRVQMFAYGVVHIGTFEFPRLGINNVSFTLLLASLLFLTILQWF